MNHELESFQKEISFVPELHEKQNAEKVVHGQRISIPSGDARLEAILYHAGSACPTIVTAFGGGFVLGVCALDDHMWTDFSKTLHVNILSVGYRKAPAYRFPTAVNDMYHAVRWTWENSGILGLDRDKIAVMGASAGGNLCASAALIDNMNGTEYIITLAIK